MHLSLALRFRDDLYADETHELDYLLFCYSDHGSESEEDSVAWDAVDDAALLELFEKYRARSTICWTLAACLCNLA